VRAHTVTFINGLRQLTILHIIPASPSLLADGWTLYSQRPDKEWSLTDCISFVVMTQEHMTRAFTSDHHFGYLFQSDPEFSACTLLQLGVIEPRGLLCGKATHTCTISAYNFHHRHFLFSFVKFKGMTRFQSVNRRFLYQEPRPGDRRIPLHRRKFVKF